MLLGTLGGNDSKLNMEFLKDLCTCISAIAVVEIPTGNWNDYVQMMTNQATQTDNKLF